MRESSPFFHSTHWLNKKVDSSIGCLRHCYLCLLTLWVLDGVKLISLPCCSRFSLGLDGEKAISEDLQYKDHPAFCSLIQWTCDSFTSLVAAWSLLHQPSDHESLVDSYVMSNQGPASLSRWPHFTQKHSVHQGMVTLVTIPLAFTFLATSFNIQVPFSAEISPTVSIRVIQDKKVL